MKVKKIKRFLRCQPLLSFSKNLFFLWFFGGLIVGYIRFGYFQYDYLLKSKNNDNFFIIEWFLLPILTIQKLSYGIDA